MKKVKNINTSQKYYHKKNVNSFGGYINKKNNKISINRKIINISKQIILSSNIKDNSYNLNNCINFKTDGFRKKNSGSIQGTSNNNDYTNRNNICYKINNKNIVPPKNDNKKTNKVKKKRQLDNYSDYYKLRSFSKDNLCKINVI